MTKSPLAAPALSCAAALAVAAAVAGCGGAQVVAFDATGFRHPRFDYHVGAVGPGSLLGPGWQLDNYQLDRSGRPLASKRGQDYRVRRRVDVDGDGVIDSLGEEDAYDLRFLSRTDAGVVWVRTAPLSSQLAHTDLRVLMRLYVEGIAGTGLMLTDLGAGRVEVVERRYATREVASGPTVVDGREAFEATIEIANVDQLELSRDARWQRARIVLVRTDLLWAPVGSSSRTLRQLLPVLMVVGYSNLPEDFASHEREIDALLSRISFDSPDVHPRRDAVLACTAAPRVRIYRWSPGWLATPDLDRAQSECVRRALSGARLTRYSYGIRRPEARARVQPAPPGPTPPSTPDDHPPEAPAETPPHADGAPVR